MFSMYTFDREDAGHTVGTVNPDGRHSTSSGESSTHVMELSQSLLSLPTRCSSNLSSERRGASEPFSEGAAKEFVSEDLELEERDSPSPVSHLADVNADVGIIGSGADGERVPLVSTDIGDVLRCIVSLVPRHFIGREGTNEEDPLS